MTKGHARLEAARKLGTKDAPVDFQDYGSEKEELADMIADNRIAELAEADRTMLRELADHLDDGSFDMDLTGFDRAALEELMTAAPPASDVDAEPQIDKAEELAKKWKVKLGQVYELGEHVLMCGDSTKRKDLSVIKGNGVSVVISDPPYGISVVSGSGKIGGDNAAKTGTYRKVIGDETTNSARLFYQLCIDIGFLEFGFWGGNYFTDFLPPSPCWFIWDKRGDMASNNFADCELMWTNLSKPSRLFKQVWSGMIKEGEHGKRVHPTQKPVQVVKESISLFDQEVVVDGFLGSSTTIIACEQLGRKCRAMEIDPGYVAVAIQRWADATGKTPRLLK